MELHPTPLDPREVEVWFVELLPHTPSIDICAGWLSDDEQERASRFRFTHLRESFTLSRGILRALLGHYLSIHPADLRFAYGERGKPSVAFPETSLAFNMTHSGRFAAYAFAVGCELGVDIEEIKRVPDQDGIVGRFFSKEECEDWFTLDPALRHEAFFRCWTRKEAYIKAVGDGLSMPLDSFRVSLLPGVPAALLHAVGDPAIVSQWELHSLEPADGYAGALALPERSRTLRVHARLTAAALLEMVSRSL